MIPEIEGVQIPDYINRISKMVYAKPFLDLKMSERQKIIEIGDDDYDLQRAIEERRISVAKGRAKKEGGYYVGMGRVPFRTSTNIKEGLKKFFKRYPLKDDSTVIFGEEAELLKAVAKPYNAATLYPMMHNRSALIKMAVDEGKYTDGYMAVLKHDPKLEKMWRKVEDRNKESMIADKMKKDGLSKTKAEQWYKENRAQMVSPKMDQLIPKDDTLSKKPGYLMARKGKISYVSDGQNIQPVDADLFAYVRESLPEAEARINKKEGSPMVFVENGEPVGLLMPMFVAEVPPVIRERLTGQRELKIEKEPPKEKELPKPKESARKKIGALIADYRKRNYGVSATLAKQATYHGILDGWRDVDDLREYLQTMAPDGITFDAYGHEITRPMLLQMLVDIEKKPKLKPWKAIEPVKIEKGKAQRGLPRSLSGIKKELQSLDRQFFKIPEGQRTSAIADPIRERIQALLGKAEEMIKSPPAPQGFKYGHPSSYEQTTSYAVRILPSSSAPVISWGKVILFDERLDKNLAKYGLEFQGSFLMPKGEHRVGKAVRREFLVGPELEMEKVKESFYKDRKRTVKTPKKTGTVTRRRIKQAVKKAPPRRKREKPTPLSLSEARKIQKERSKRSQVQDKRKTAQTIIPPRKGSRWARNPGRSDMRGVDTKR